MKKKFASLAIVLCLVLIAATGITLAYFTDTDMTTNRFTSGKVDITLNEKFGTQAAIPGVQDDERTMLIPGVEIQKEVTISLSEDSVESYVWYTYAIPAVLDSAEDSSKIVHVNHAGRNLLGFRDKQEYWTEGQTAATPENQCWILDYAVEKDVMIDNVAYNVHTVLYNGTLKAGEETTIGMTKVYLDKRIDFDHDKGVYVLNGNEINYDLSDVKIIVTAYGIQAATFTTPQEAFEAYASQTVSTPENAIDID